MQYITEYKDEDKCKISYVTENRSSQIKVLDDVENQSTLQYKDLRSSHSTQEAMLQQMSKNNLFFSIHIFLFIHKINVKNIF